MRRGVLPAFRPAFFTVFFAAFFAAVFLAGLGGLAGRFTGVAFRGFPCFLTAPVFLAFPTFYSLSDGLFRGLFGTAKHSVIALAGVGPSTREHASWTTRARSAASSAKSLRHMPPWPGIG